MSRTVTMIIMVSATLVCSNAFAIKQLVYLSPNSTTFRVEPQKGGMMRFTIVRNPADAHKPQNKSLILVRSANLSVSDASRTLLTAPIAPRVNKDGKLIYEFSISKEHAPHSVFTLSEIDGTRARSGYMGGGTIYKYTMNGNPLIQDALRRVLGKKSSIDKEIVAGSH
jgi:hypothetical protein